MANNENTVQIQVEVLRAQLDKLIADINSLKNQNISETSAMEALGFSEEEKTGYKTWCEANNNQ